MDATEPRLATSMWSPEARFAQAHRIEIEHVWVPAALSERIDRARGLSHAVVPISEGTDAYTVMALRLDATAPCAVHLLEIFVTSQSATPGVTPAGADIG
jgi:hypothetical protein